ncbi:uncharacterized protein LOC142922739 isoform X1 [Petromyzon marinus]|uniref:uncharacterized protein LOC142922739 isoform X1 n=2 Tax=Petromyzon marinus TaxID=7757 RepID=UPI003F71E773
MAICCVGWLCVSACSGLTSIRVGCVGRTTSTRQCQHGWACRVDVCERELHGSSDFLQREGTIVILKIWQGDSRAVDRSRVARASAAHVVGWSGGASSTWPRDLRAVSRDSGKRVTRRSAIQRPTWAGETRGRHGGTGIMNQEKLAKLQTQVRIGGKGTARRKRKIVHRTAPADDRKLQSSLKKLSVNNITGIEEVNMFREDGMVLHFNNPKVQATIGANTFAVSGHAESRHLSDMLPAVLNQMAVGSLSGLRRLAAAPPHAAREPVDSNPLEVCVEEEVPGRVQLCMTSERPGHMTKLKLQFKAFVTAMIHLLWFFR